MNLRRFTLSIVLLSLSALFFNEKPLHSQGITTGSVNGTVVDQQKAVVPGADVVAIDKATGTKFETKSNEQGGFSLRNLPGGSYTLTISATSFTPLKVDTVTVTSGSVISLGDEALTIGGSATTIEISGDTSAILETQQSQVQSSFGTTELPNLPLNGLIDNLMQFVPGVVKAHDLSFSNSNGDDYSVNGQRSRSNNFEIDGQSNNDNSVGGSQVFFSNQDAIKEVQVVTSNLSAQYGRNMGAVVNYVTKNGTNSFHGSGYEFYTGSFLSSLSNDQKSSLFGFCAPGEDPTVTGCTPPVVPRTVDNRFGGTIGGPIFKNKLWFFYGTNWEKTRNGASPASSGSTLTPTPAGIAELQSAYPGSPAVAALANNGPYAVPIGNPIPVSGSQVIESVVGPNGVVDNNVEFAAVQRFAPSLFNDQEQLGRVDWQPTGKDHLFVRYIYQNQITTNVNGNTATGYFYDVPATTHSIGADWTHTFGTTWTNQVRYSFQQTKVFFQGGALANCVSTTLAQCTASVSISGGFAGFGYGSSLPQGRTVKVTQVQDNASWQHGKHTISFGGDFTYQNSPNVFLPDFNGSYNFGNFNNFLQGIGTLTLGNGNPVIPFTEPDYSLYFQDDYHIAPFLTLNLGLRWEFFDQAVNLLHNETVKRETGPAPFWDTSLPLSERTYALTDQNYKNFQPRIGFAYNNPDFVRNLVIRGGFGINFDPEFYNMFLNSATAAPVINLGTIVCDGVTVQCLPANGVKGADVRNLNLPLLPGGVNPNTRSLTNNTTVFKNPYTESYLLGVEYGIGNAGVLSASYVGSHTVGNFQALNSNPYLLDLATNFPNMVSPSSLCDDPGQFDNGRLHCGQGNVNTRANTSFNNYNALQLSLKTRAFHGLTTNTSYTYSRAINNVDEVYSNLGGAGAIAFAQNPLDTNVAERGVAAISFPTVAAVAAVYDLPFYKNQAGLIGRLLGGFTISAAYDYNSGQPWSPFEFYGANINDGSALNSSSYCDPKFNPARVGQDTCRPILANRKAPIGSVGIYVVDPDFAFTTNGTGYYVYGSLDENFNLNQPTSPDAVHWLWNNQAYANTVGNPYPGVGRNTQRGQAYNNIDAAIVKTTKLTEGVALNLYLNGFNVANHQFLGTPDSYVEDAGSSFGSTAYNASNIRSFQLGAKITF